MRYVGVARALLRERVEDYARMASVSPAVKIAQETAQAQRDLSEVESEYRADRKRSLERLEESRQEVENEGREWMDREAAEWSDAAEEIRKNALDNEKKRNQMDQSRVDRLKTDVYDRYGQAKERSIVQDQEVQRKQFETMKKGYEVQANEGRNEKEFALRKLSEGYEDQLKEASRYARTSREEEAAALRENINSMIANERALKGEMGKTREATIRELEDPYRERMRVMEAGFSGVIEDNKADMASQERDLRAKFSKRAIDMEAKRVAEANTAKKAHGDEVNNLRNEFETQAKKQKELHQADLQRLKSGEGRSDQKLREMIDATVLRQNENFNKSLANNKDMYQNQIDVLHDEIQRKEVSSNLSDIPPAAESMLRKKIITEQMKSQDADRDRFAKRHEATQEYYKDRISKISDDAQRKELELNSQLLKAKNGDRNQVLGDFKELESRKLIAEREAEDNIRRATENMYRENSRTMLMVREKMNEQVDVTQEQSVDRVKEVQQQADFKERLTTREFLNRSRELVRENQRKLDEQKDMYEGMIVEMKVANEKALRDAERQAKKVQDELQRDFTQRIKEMESQAKEKERTVVRNYEDEIDKLRKTNQAIQKSRALG